MKEKKDFKTLALTVWDILFVLVLCFAVLLLAMLLMRRLGEGDFSAGYVISWPMLIGVVAALCVFLAYVLRKSTKEYRSMVEQYSGKEDADDGE